MKDRITMLLKSRASRDMLPFRIGNKKKLVIRHLSGTIFQTTLGNYVGLRTYHHHIVRFVCLCVCVCVCVCMYAGSRLYIVWFWNLIPVEMENSVQDTRKPPRVVTERNIFTRLQMAGGGVNHPHLPNDEIKEMAKL
jgi:hypothetical protein